VSASGNLLVAPGALFDNQLVWVSQTGSERVIPSGPRRYISPRVSPEGRRIAFAAASTIWTLDLDRNTFTRVTAETDPVISYPLWSRDGKSIYYRSTDGLRMRNADGSGASTLLPNTGPTDYPNSFTPDGQTLVLQRLGPKTAADLYTTPARGGPLTPLLVTNAYEAAADVSPDGKWITYVSNESGRMNVYLRPFGGPDRKWTVSSQGGTHPIWSVDGRRIFYRSGNQVIGVDVTTSPEVQLGEPRVLFERRYSFGQSITLANESISHDGKDLLMVEELPDSRYLNLVLNWLPPGGRR
jgi:serine/threonine-protein kinase